MTWRVRGRIAAAVAFSAITVAVAVAMLSGADRAEDAWPVGPFTVRIEDRKVGGIATRLFLPEGDAAGRKSPLVLYLPGWGGNRDENDVLLKDLASFGLIVAASDDVAEDAAELEEKPEDHAARSGGFQLANAADLAGFDAISRRRTLLAAAKARRLLDALLADVRPGTADAQAIGVVGYSHGGAAAGVLMARDSRIRAAVNLDGWVRGTDLVEGVDRPYLGLFAEMNLVQMPNWLWPQRYWAIRFMADEVPIMRRLEAQFGAQINILSGLQHPDFSDQRARQFRWLLWRPWRLKVLGTGEIRALLNGLVIPFLTRALAPDAARPTLASFDTSVVKRLSQAYGED